MYKIMLYTGILGTIIMFLITILIFIKGNVLELIKDLLGIRTSSKKHRQESFDKKTEVEKVNIDNKKEKCIEEINNKKETEMLESKEETILLEDEETIILSEDENETIILFEEENREFYKEVDVMIVNSNVLI